MGGPAEERMPLYLEDLAIGQRFESPAREIELDEILAFAGRYDPQPFHTDETAAQQSFFGGLAASGWHTAAFSMRLVLDGGPPFAWGMIGAGGEIAWPRPTRPGDRLRVVCEILEIAPSRSRPDRGLVTIRNQTLNQHDEVVQVLTARMLVPKRPG
jgi:acyl dehydratase